MPSPRLYSKADVSEQQLEDLIRQHSELMEEGLIYVDHQRQTKGGRLDVLLADSGKALVVAELKVVQDDGMLLQGLDYYDFVTTNIETYARLYSSHGIDPKQDVRLCLVAPSFSQSMLNRCKWFDIPLSLFTYNCLKLDGREEVIPVFSELPISQSTRPNIEIVQLNDHLDYITDADVRQRVVGLLEEVKTWKPGAVSLDPVTVAISIKVNGRVLAYVHTRRKHFIVATYSEAEEWTEYAVRDDADLENVKQRMRASLDRRGK